MDNFTIVKEYRCLTIFLFLEALHCIPLQTMNRLVRMLKEDNEHIMIKVDRFLSSEGISGLGDQPFVRMHCYKITRTHTRSHNDNMHNIHVLHLMPTKMKLS